MLHRMLFALALVASSAQADFVYYEADASFLNTTTLNVPQFDPELGELNGLYIAIRAEISGSFTLANTSDTLGYFQVKFRPLLYAQEFPYYTGQYHSFDVELTGGVAPHSAQTRPYSVIVASDWAPTQNLGLYFGNGTWTLTPYLFQTNQQRSFSPGMSVQSSVLDPIDLQLNVAYDYTPVTDTPEPSTYVTLIGLGLAGMGYCVKRRQSSRGTGAST